MWMYRLSSSFLFEDSIIILSACLTPLSKISWDYICIGVYFWGYLTMLFIKGINRTALPAKPPVASINCLWMLLNRPNLKVSTNLLFMSARSCKTHHSSWKFNWSLLASSAPIENENQSTNNQSLSRGRKGKRIVAAALWTFVNFDFIDSRLMGPARAPR